VASAQNRATQDHQLLWPGLCDRSGHDGFKPRSGPPRSARIGSEPNALDAVIDKDLQAALISLELLKGFYKSKTDKKE